MTSNAALLSALAMLVAVSGCIVVAKPVTREVFVRIDESQPTEVGGGVGWEITTRIEADMANVVVTAARVQACTRVRSEVYDELETETPEVSWLLSGGVSAPHGGRFDPWDDAVGVAMIGVAGATVVFLPVTVVSAIVAEITSAAHHDTKTRKTRSLETIPSICPHVVATAPVELTLPSGAVLTGMTGSDGRVSFAIPEGEPDYGTAITRVADQMQSAPFFKTTETCERARNEIFARAMGATAVAQRWQLLRALPTACGDPRARVVADGDGSAGRSRGAMRLDQELRRPRPGDRSRAVQHPLHLRARHRAMCRRPHRRAAASRRMHRATERGDSERPAQRRHQGPRASAQQPAGLRCARCPGSCSVAQPESRGRRT